MKKLKSHIQAAEEINGKVSNSPLVNLRNLSMILATRFQNTGGKSVGSIQESEHALCCFNSKIAITWNVYVTVLITFAHAVVENQSAMIDTTRT